MKSIYFTLLFIFASFICSSQELGVTSHRYFLPDFNAPAMDISSTYENGFAVVGTVEYDQNNSIPYLMVCDSFGQQLWTKPYSNFNTEFAFNRVIQLYDSSFVVVGKMLNPLQADFGAACLRLDKNGNELWKKSIGDNSGEIFVANDVIQTADSSLLIVGTIRNKGSFLMKLDLTGTKIWSKNYYFEGNLSIDFQELVAAKEKSNGHFVAVGTTNYGGENYRGYIFETDAAGDLIWLKRFNEPSIFTDVMIASDGLLIRCFTQSANLIKTSFSGDFTWGKRYMDEDYEWFIFPRMNQFSDGNFGVCGSSFTYGSMVKVNSSGAVLFDAGVFGRTNSMVENRNKSVAVLSNGPVYGVKQQGIFDKHFAVAQIDSLDNNLSIFTENCFWDLNPQTTVGTLTTYNDTLFLGNELLVYDAMMELFSSTFEQEEACVIFLGDVEEKTRSNYQLFPNPVTSVLTIYSDNKSAEKFELIDQQGRILKSGILAQFTTEIKVEELKSGFYSVRIGPEVLRFIKD